MPLAGSGQGTRRRPLSKISNRFNGCVVLRQQSCVSIYPFRSKCGKSLGALMLNRLTVSALLKIVILTTAFCVVVGFSLNAWESWGRVQVASRILVIAEASASLFKAMHNLRTD